MSFADLIQQSLYYKLYIKLNDLFNAFRTKSPTQPKRKLCNDEAMTSRFMIRFVLPSPLQEIQ